MKKLISLQSLILIILIACFSCTDTGKIKNEKKVVLISKDKKGNYRKWLKRTDSTLNYVALYGIKKDSVDYYLSICSGVLITGGEDICPSLYGKEKMKKFCQEPDLYRDTLELKMIKYATENKIPLLGICRGEQFLNVANGGTLIIDIPKDFKTNLIHDLNKDTAHAVYIAQNSLLYRICKVDSGFVNSYHHQAVEKISDMFIAVAHTSDKLIEAIELKNKLRHPFILGVQWHPERMAEKNKLSAPIAEYFIEMIKKTKR